MKSVQGNTMERIIHMFAADCYTYRGTSKASPRICTVKPTTRLESFLHTDFWGKK